MRSLLYLRARNKRDKKSLVETTCLFYQNVYLDVFIIWNRIYWSKKAFSMDCRLLINIRDLATFKSFCLTTIILELWTLFNVFLHRTNLVNISLKTSRKKHQDRFQGPKNAVNQNWSTKTSLHKKINFQTSDYATKKKTNKCSFNWFLSNIFSCFAFVTATKSYRTYCFW